MTLRFIIVLLALLNINSPTFGYHLHKGALKSDKPSCGPRVLYIGGFPNMPTGGCHGEAKYKDSSLYKGEYEEKLKYPKATSPALVGVKYIAAHGKGTLETPEGFKFVGEFDNNKFVFGAVYKDGKFVHGGKFKNWKFVKAMPTPYSPKGVSIAQDSKIKSMFKSLKSGKRKTIQQNLKAEGLYNSTIDGLYGRGTERALKEYNKKYLSNSDLKKKDNVSTLLSKLQEAEVQTPKVVAKKVDEKIEVVATKTDTKKINTEWQLLAEEGSAMAQYKLAYMYEKGDGLLKDFVYAHMWANLSATNGYGEAKDLRDALEKKMTASQMEKAQDLARECMRKKYKGC